MGLDELVDDTEEQKKVNDIEELKDKLGIESEEDLEELDDRMSDTFNMMISLDQRVNELEDDVRVLRQALAKYVSEDDSDWSDGVEF